jgi:hypothetical protein
MSAVWTPANPPAEARIPCIQANSNRSPRYSVGPRMTASMGERPRSAEDGGPVFAGIRTQRDRREDLAVRLRPFWPAGSGSTPQGSNGL